MYTFIIGEDGEVIYGTNNGIIYNKKKTVEPDNPVNPPDKPEEPIDPVVPDEPDNSDKPNVPDTPQEPEIPDVPVNPVKPDASNDYTGSLPKTGETLAILIIAVIALSGSGIILTYNYIKIKKASR